MGKEKQKQRMHEVCDDTGEEDVNDDDLFLHFKNVSFAEKEDKDSDVDVDDE